MGSAFEEEEGENTMNLIVVYEAEIKEERNEKKRSLQVVDCECFTNHLRLKSYISIQTRSVSRACQKERPSLRIQTFVCMNSSMHEYRECFK